MSYRGRLLIALKTDISDSIDTAPSEVEVMPTQTINEVSGIIEYEYCITRNEIVMEGEILQDR